MITKEEIQVFETRLSELMANFKAQVMAELEKMGAKDTFLAEISQPVPLAADEPERAGELPDMNDIEIPETKPELPFLEKGSHAWQGLITHIMTKDVKEIPQVGTKFQLTSKDWAYIKDLLYYKNELFLGNMDAGQIASQGVDEVDRHWFIEMQQTLKSLV